jgi:hypothetical protein
MRRTLTLVVAAIGLALVTSLPAAALPPEHFPPEQVDETFVLEGVCDFPVEIHVTGTVRHSHYFDQDGNEIRDITVFPNFKITITNLETGESLTTPSPGVETVELNPDGSATITLTGLLGRLAVPGVGIVAQDVGRIVFFFSDPADEEPDITFIAGKFLGEGDPFPEVCEVLG